MIQPEKKMYRRYQSEVTEYGIVSETWASLVYMDKNGKVLKERKVSGEYSWHPTLESAVMELKQRCNERIEMAKFQIEMAQKELQRIYEKYKI